MHVNFLPLTSSTRTLTLVVYAVYILIYTYCRCECVILEDELHFKLQNILNLVFKKSEKIPECSQQISIPVYKFSSRNTIYSILGKNNKIADLGA
jgi:hypothetical protein